MGFLIGGYLDDLEQKPAPVRDNLTTHERQACKMLSRRNGISIKSADKGSGTVVMDRDWYINECLRQLDNTKFYKLLHNDITTDIQKRILKYTERMNRDKIINEETKRYLIQTDPKPGRFYILPKVYKQGNPGRPILTICRPPSQTFGADSQSFIKDTCTLPQQTRTTWTTPRKLSSCYSRRFFSLR